MGDGLLSTVWSEKIIKLGERTFARPTKTKKRTAGEQRTGLLLCRKVHDRRLGIEELCR